MKIGKNSATFNLGDTSFRRKTLIDDYFTLLPYLLDTFKENEVWDNIAQAYFYEKVSEKTDLFARKDDKEPDKRGRTLTNALVKIGLTNEKRKLSKVALNWMNGTSTLPDKIERILALDNNNILFLRQLLKLRIYNAEGNHFFYPFRVALRLMTKYQNIPQQDFLTLVHLLQPDFSEQKIDRVIEGYLDVVQGEKIFSEFVNLMFPEADKSVSVSDLFDEDGINREVFNKLFVNRKSSLAQDTYFEFVSALIKFKVDMSADNLKKLIKISNNDKIKKAFGFGKAVFEKKKTIDEFLIENEDNPLLSEDDKLIYSQFVLSKKNDLVKEYRDMTKRTFNLTGLIDYSNGLVNIINIDVARIIFDKLKLTGSEPYEEYEVNLSFDFYQDITITEILGLDESVILNELKSIFKVETDNQIEQVVVTQKEAKFRDFIYSEFPKEKILEILPLFSRRMDEEIQKRVSEFATVPTIFEYIVAIAWLHISSEEFFITKSLNLTLDGNMRPLSHAAGGAGDIVIDYKDMTLMLEVTLMNRHAQKRGEWEPVLRHATNLTVEKYPKSVTTFFVADELDENTINIWRAVASVPMKATNKNEYADIVKIFPLTNNELIDMLSTGKDEKKLLQAINQSFDAFAGDFNLAWRDEILEEADTDTE